MKVKLKVFLLLAMLTIIPALCRAQLAISLKMNRSHYLQYETVYAKISIRNNSGHAVIFGNDKRLHGKLLFKIIDSQHALVAKISKTAYPMDGVIIEAGKRKNFVVPVSRFYKLKKCGTYRLYAFVEHNMFNDTYRSNDTIFEISKGIVAWKQTVGIPEFMLPRKKQKVVNRTYKMVRLLEGSKKSNYLVIEDKRRIYSVIFLSYELGDERIAHEIDSLSRLHLLIPMSPKIFVYLIIDINGKIDEESVYKRTKTVPAMVRVPSSGKVYITGGARADRKTDYRSK